MILIKRFQFLAKLIVGLLIAIIKCSIYFSCYLFQKLLNIIRNGIHTYMGITITLRKDDTPAAPTQ